MGDNFFQKWKRNITYYFMSFTILHGVSSNLHLLVKQVSYELNRYEYMLVYLKIHIIKKKKDKLCSLARKTHALFSFSFSSIYLKIFPTGDLFYFHFWKKFIVLRSEIIGMKPKYIFWATHSYKKIQELIHLGLG